MTKNTEITLSHVFTDYLNSLRYERGCTLTTFRTYQAWLHAYEKWLRDQGHDAPDLSHFSTPLLRAYQYSLAQRKLRPRTIRVAFHGLKGAGAFLVSHGLLPVNPCDAITLPKKDAAVAATVSTDEVRAVVAGATSLYPVRQRLTALAMLHTLTQTGVRFQDWVCPKVRDVSFADGIVLMASMQRQEIR